MKKRTRKQLVLLVILLWIIWSNVSLAVNEYVIQSDKIPASFSGFRIVQVSDLHNAQFGEGNRKLLSLIRDADPDIIVVTGDMVDSRRTDIGIALEFAREAVKIAPVYYVTGNHEARIEAYAQLKTGLEQAGVTVLENEKVKLERSGETITLLGVNDPSFFARGMDMVLKELMEPSDGYTVLLSHRPELFDTYAGCGVDLVFTGHAHGGQFRIPFVGGLVAPHQGFFPQYDSGLYTAGVTNMLVSRGVGNSIVPVRFNNRPELIVVELNPVQ